MTGPSAIKVHLPGSFLHGLFLAALCIAASAGCAPNYRRHATKPQAASRVSGIEHVVREGETLWAIAKAYGLEDMDIYRANDIEDPANLPAGQKLLIPGVTEEKHPAPGSDTPASDPELGSAKPKRRGISSEKFFVRPLSGPILKEGPAREGPATQAGRKPAVGIDLPATIGAEVLAAKSGIVSSCTTIPVWGKVIIIDHGSGESTFYGRLDRFLAAPGDEVKQGQAIAKLGGSGNARPMLHFRIYRDYKAVDPKGRFPN